MTSGDPVPAWNAVAQSDLSWEGCLPSWRGFGLDPPEVRPPPPGPTFFQEAPTLPSIRGGSQAGSGGAHEGGVSAAVSRGGRTRHPPGACAQPPSPRSASFTRLSLCHPAARLSRPVRCSSLAHLSLVRSLSPSLQHELPEDREPALALCRKLKTLIGGLRRAPASGTPSAPQSSQALSCPRRS